MVVGIFTKSCNHHCYLIPELNFITPERNPTPISNHTHSSSHFSLSNLNLLSVPMDLHNWDISHKFVHVTWGSL